MTKQIQSNRTVFVQSAMNMRTESEYVYELRAANSSSSKKNYTEKDSHTQKWRVKIILMFFSLLFFTLIHLLDNLHSSISCWTVLFFRSVFLDGMSHQIAKIHYHLWWSPLFVFFFSIVVWNERKHFFMNLYPQQPWQLTLFFLFSVVVICHFTICWLFQIY